MTESVWYDVMLLSFCWVGYFALHSLLASLAVKNRVAAGWPKLMPYYRMTYNILALLLLLPIVWLSYNNSESILWRWQGIAAWLANGLALAAILGFWLSLKSYDMQEFLGLRQLQSHVRNVEDQEQFHLSPFHRFVRHPWYFFGLILIWTRDMSVTTLLSSVLITFYFIVGSWLEEKKLLVYHGDTYRRYMTRVPGLIPLPWKFLTAEEVEALLEQSNTGINGAGSFNLLIGVVLTIMVTAPTLEFMFYGEAKQPSFLPVNAWLWPTLLILLASGLLIALFGLMRRVHWGYFLWSQTTLSFWVFLLYLGRSRADRDFPNFRGDDDAPIEGPPEVLWYRFAFLVLVWVVVGFLPLALRYLWKRHKARRSRPEKEGVDSSEGN